IQEANVRQPLQLPSQRPGRETCSARNLAAMKRFLGMQEKQAEHAAAIAWEQGGRKRLMHI
ncbi:MAG TPA: hypothetical protein VF730_03820, partial [Terracidiphilus sp.]